ncbi:hypothetical protein GOFOIKOB_3027 [Methylobacterium tardum]|uniref:Uncharacterized protein n=1 Tax=Methylobacterium tardum TaxID=374432 RepID=A0AA37TE39_9HYPH|nr:hypothetical protein [Methylobacterium tardum]URD38368.1 hypothetical protein M6G65_07965 [Methylobacterium tardum]GJE49986.1 hypothetical protein GOFOIKOB_3027 [Methylobacterium tardum]GLS70192.1 hypothetical protein GCM10007890_22050 [Methylobacterium tardum]
MAITIRHFVFEEAGNLRSVPRRVCEGLWQGEDALPDYAGTRQRVAQIIVENDDGKPARILDAKGSFWQFDEAGKLVIEPFDFSWAFDRPARSKATVLDLRPKLERKKWEAKHRWPVTSEELDRISAVIWPWAAAEIEEVRPVKGTAVKVPPLTHDGERALSKIQTAFGTIGYELEQLSEPALKGLAHELRRYARIYDGERILYEAFAAEVDRLKDIRIRQRTGKGGWYAFVRIMRWDEARTQAEEIDTIEERCEGKKAALVAARRLLAENAHRLGDGITVEADVATELDWVPKKISNDRAQEG